MVKKKTQKEFIEDVYRKWGDEFIVEGEYKSSSTPIALRHKTCDSLVHMRPNNLLQGASCKVCLENSKKKTTDTFSKEVDEVSKGRLKLIGAYTGCDDITTFWCNTHNKICKGTPTNFLKGQMICSDCKVERIVKTQAKSTETFKKELSTVNNNLELMGEYKNTHTKTAFLCKQCNHIFEAEPNSVLCGSGCPRCRHSRGERLVASILDELGIHYTTQKTFKSCKNKRLLPFDFFLEDYSVLIEFDGLQHYKPITFFGGQDAFVKRQLLDNIKTDFAKNHNIPLLRIPFNMDRVLIINLIKEVTQETLSDRV